MAAGVTIKQKRKAGAFSNGQLVAGEIGVNTSTPRLEFSADGSTSRTLSGTGSDAESDLGFRGVPQNAQTGNYTLVLGDSGKHIFHASGAGSGDTYTIPANSSVAFPIGTAITFVNLDSSAVSIAITTDMMRLAGPGTTGTRSLAQYGVATAIKVASTTWIISGTGLT